MLLRVFIFLLFLCVAALFIVQYHTPTLVTLRRVFHTAELAGCPTVPIVSTQGTKHGRLGNRMWNYANVLVLGLTLGRPAYLPRRLRDPLAEVFANLSVPALEDVAHCDLRFAEPHRVEDETANGELKELYRGRNLMLSAQGRLTHLAKGYLPLLRGEFRFRTEILQEVNQTLDEVNPERRETVAVHVRRKDYLTYLMARLYGTTAVNEKYFQDSMQWFRDKYPERNFIFLVVSDDVEWCREHLKGDDVVIASKGVGHDMALMASCDHAIIDCGSYGFWGALFVGLRGGQVLSLNLTSKYLDVVRDDPRWHLINTLEYVQIVANTKNGSLN